MASSSILTTLDLLAPGFARTTKRIVELFDSKEMLFGIDMVRLVIKHACDDGENCMSICAYSHSSDGARQLKLKFHGLWKLRMADLFVIEANIN